MCVKNDVTIGRRYGYVSGNYPNKKSRVEGDMQAVVFLLLIPLMLLNFFGGIVSGIWLAFLGQWAPLLTGIAASLISYFVIGLMLMPGLFLFGAPAIALAERGRMVLATPFLLLSQLYIYSLVTVWCLGVFFFFVSRANSQTFLPLLIWSYGVALGPWMFLAKKDRMSGGDAPASTTTFFAQISYIVIACMATFGHFFFETLMMVFAAIMLVGMLLQTFSAVVMLYAESRRSMPRYM